MSAHSKQLFLNRETSWLEFNRRVLEEARDPANPLLERIRFFCIFHSNLDEFFMVRVASLLRMKAEGNSDPDPSGLSPFQQLELIGTMTRKLCESSDALYQEDLAPSMEREGIRLLLPSSLEPAQQKYLDDYFEKEVFPVLTPVAIDATRPIPWLPGLAFNLAATLESAQSEEIKTRLAVVQIPGRIPGLCRLPDGETFAACWLHDIVRQKLGTFFSGYRIREIGGFRITRDAEVELDDEGRYDYVSMLESEIKKRQRGMPVRVEYEASMSQKLMDLLRLGLGVGEAHFVPGRAPLDPRPLLSIVDMPGFDRLRYKPQIPIRPPAFEQGRNVFEIIREGDVLLHHPYDCFDPAIEFLQAAAADPEVLAIKQTLYRTSGRSSLILGALLDAAESGKQVTVLVELTARFDEERNIGWARDLEAAGAHVLYGIAGLKVHAKITLVIRRDPGGIRRYVHLGTGNYNERTARVYTDFGLFTASDDFGSDASAFFNTITGYSEPPMFSRLVMAPAGMRDRICLLIRREANRAREGEHAEILGKMNSLADPTIIRELYLASKAGVQIKLNVRGICTLRPGVPDLSENIQVVSIVDRYLEHSRAFIFHNGGNSETYLSSADWMPRNLDRRIELMFPVISQQLAGKVMSILQAQFADNQKSRSLKPEGSYEAVATKQGEALRAQEYLYQSRLEEQARARAVTPVRFVPIEGS
jgi:polyphosphate kinase